jgi:uncharacterized protein
MAQPFLKAEWRNLLMANYAIDPQVLKKYVPRYTELDEYNGIYYVSLVGFLFQDTKVRGLSFPFHRSFEEVNLRFYVRYKEGGHWKRGVVFMKEIVPRRMITFVANTIYREKYATHKMKHVWQKDQHEFKVEYSWKVGREWNYLKAIAESEAFPIKEGSEEEFITEHYLGYTFISDRCTGVYEVTHPKWKVHAVKSFGIKCSTERLYGKDFVAALEEPPLSVFLAEGSAIGVMVGSRIYS